MNTNILRNIGTAVCQFASGPIASLGNRSKTILVLGSLIKNATMNPHRGTDLKPWSRRVLLGALLSMTAPLHANLIDLETGDSWHPEWDEDGNPDSVPDWVDDEAEDAVLSTDMPSHDSTFIFPQDAASSPNTVTIHGHVFYNDRRGDGLFSKRKTPDGVSTGTRCNPDGFRDNKVSCSENWLGAHYMVVDVIERDEGYFLPTAWNCKHEDVLTSVAVNSDGSFTASFYPSDDCDSDALANLAIVLKVSLRFCGTWCFSVVDKKNEPYWLYYPGATPSAPLSVTAGDVVELPRMNFYPGGTSPSQANDTAIAANYYASLVDTILTLHRDSGIPFYKEEFGEVQVQYPSTDTGSATALSPTKIALIDKNEWVRGEVVTHEYGHVVMMRAWGGSYGWDGVGNGGVKWNIRDPQEPRIAFKEGWGNFISRAVFTETMAYNDPWFDDNETTSLPGSLGRGSEFVTNVNKLLSDWYDHRNDPLDGTGDHFGASDLYSMWYNLRNMYLHVNSYGGDFNAGLTICDYINYYLDVRRSITAVGVTDHNGYVNSVTDLAYNNNTACFLPAP